MKVNIDKLTKRDINGIKRWLRANDITFCPFYWKNLNKCFLDGLRGNSKKCKTLFPSLKIDSDPWGNKAYLCPCVQLSTKYVIKRAKYVVKKWEEKNK